MSIYEIPGLPTQGEFAAYESVRLSGLYNMITEASNAAIATGLSSTQYRAVLTHYGELTQLYPDVRGNA